MKVLIVCDNIGGKGNGLASSARRTVKYLTEAGIDVKVLSMRNPDKDGYSPDFVLEKFHFPFFQWLLDLFGYSFPKHDRKIIREALDWCDVVHIETAFPMEWITANIAVKLGKPRVATFHLHPENITYQLGMSRWKHFNHMLMRIFRNVVYDKMSDVQCPTENVRRRLQEFNFKADLHVISNGIPLDSGQPVPTPQTDPYLVTSVGRLSKEKDQFTLLNAMRYSKYSDRIQLYFAGRGLIEKKLRKMSDNLLAEGVLRHKPEFAFHSQDELKALARRAYLNVHCAVIEVEGLSCLEFLREGAVPVIAEGELTATACFALDGRSLFPAKDPKALAERIDWWIEHPQERMEMGHKYIKYAGQFEIRRSIDKLIEMYQKAIDSQK